jgi:glycosyltransferase 2 family protein
VRRFASLALRLAVSGALIGWLLSRANLAAIGLELSAVGSANVALILGLQLVNTALKSYKWQQLLAADGIHLSHGTAFASYMVSTFFSVFLPTAIGGDAVRAVDTARRSGRGVATATSVVADRVLGFAAIGLVGLASIAAGAAAAIDPHLRAVGAMLYLFVLATAMLAFADVFGWAAPWFGRRLFRVQGAMRMISASIAAYRDSGGLWRWVLVSVAAQVIVVLAVWVIARALAIAAPLPYFFAIVPLVSLVESVPVSIFGIGTRDVSYVYLLGLVGVSEDKALSVSLLYVLLTLLYALLGGLVFALRGSVRAAAEGTR